MIPAGRGASTHFFSVATVAFLQFDDYLLTVARGWAGVSPWMYYTYTAVTETGTLVGSAFFGYVLPVSGYVFPAIGLLCFFSSMLSAYEYNVNVRSAHPVYGERHGYDPLPYSNVGSQTVHDYAASLSQSRRIFMDTLGNTQTAEKAVGLVDKTTAVFDTAALAHYGFFIPVV